MNIRNLLGLNHSVTSVSSAGRLDRQIKSESTHDRDANGQQLFNQQKKKEKMTQEQFEKAIALLREKSFIKEMNWSVMAFEDDGVKYAWVKDNQGNTIRKLIEYDLWEVFEHSGQDSTKGQLLKKTA